MAVNIGALPLIVDVGSGDRSGVPLGLCPFRSCLAALETNICMKLLPLFLIIFLIACDDSTTTPVDAGPDGDATEDVVDADADIVLTDYEECIP